MKVYYRQTEGQNAEAVLINLMRLLKVRVSVPRYA
jgi:hypothetical protein